MSRKDKRQKVYEERQAKKLETPSVNEEAQNSAQGSPRAMPEPLPDTPKADKGSKKIVGLSGEIAFKTLTGGDKQKLKKAMKAREEEERLIRERILK